MGKISYGEKIIYKMLIESIANDGWTEDNWERGGNVDGLLEIVHNWLVEFGYNKERKYFDKILYVCNQETKVPFGEGVDIFIIGKNTIESLRGKKYIHWFKEEGLAVSNEYVTVFESTLFSR